MSPSNTPDASIGKFLGDISVSLHDRINLVRMAVMQGDAASEEVLGFLIKRCESEHAESHYVEKLSELNAMLRDIEQGPLRPAVFDTLEEPDTAGLPAHARILIEDGSVAYCIVPDAALAKSLRRGDRVLIDGKGKAVLRRTSSPQRTGEEATFERPVSEGHVEVTLRNQERSVFMVSAALEEEIRKAAVTPGDTLLVNPRQQFAYASLPKTDGVSHYRFLDTSPVPNVIAERDMGIPPAIIGKVAQMVRDEMTSPDSRRRFRLRRMFLGLLSGIPGTGKTYTIEAIWRKIYEIASEVTGFPIAVLPPRVFRLKASKILSEWFGVADKNVDRFFDEVEQLAGDQWIAPDGSRHELPVILIIEEIDGIARTRGQEGLHDRILNGILQRLDPNRAALADKLIVCLSTTNSLSSCDGAFLRRVSGHPETFGKLSRGAFAATLSTQIAGMPLSANGSADARASLLADLSAWLYSRNGADPGVLEMTYAGSTTPEIRYRRDFLTGALLDRAVQQAAEKAAHEYASHSHPGLSVQHLVESIDAQIRATAAQIDEHNIANFLEVRDGVRVATVRRLPQPGHFPLQLQSN